MSALEYATMWLADKLDRDETGQTATEYVLVILGVVLFLVFAAFALNGILGSATNAMSGKPSLFQSRKSRPMPETKLPSSTNATPVSNAVSSNLFPRL